jgi:hypothetical protein
MCFTSQREHFIFSVMISSADNARVSFTAVSGFNLGLLSQNISVCQFATKFAFEFSYRF